MSEHTKGKWTIEPTGIDGNDDKLIIGHPDPDDFNVIRTIGRLFFSRPYPEMHENARLIATAPETAQQRDDLFTACKRYIAYREGGDDDIVKIAMLMKVVIAKSEVKAEVI